MTVQLYLGDCLEVMKSMPENSVDTCITDPPYELGFMGKKWDSSGIAFQPDTWAEVYRLLKPGAILLAFGGTRTYHRMVCAIEDAGFEIRDTIAWVYGSGFPKSYDISKGIDKQAGAEREVTGKYKRPDGTNRDYQGWNESSGVTSFNSDNYSFAGRPITAPSTPEAQLWDGWGTALKPAHEPIVVAMKPLDGTFVNNALTWGTAGLWIDGGRVGTDEVGARARSNSESGNTNMLGVNAQTNFQGAPTQGRFPANFIHDGSDEVKELFPETKSGSINGTYNNTIMAQSNGDRNGKPIHLEFNGDSGSAARFFYCAKASKRDRDEGCEGIEERKSGMSNGAQKHGDGYDKGQDIGLNRVVARRNHHPTVKPTDLMRYLCRLVTPPGGTVLDPFMGSGSTGKACALEGFRFIGIERETEYCKIAEARIAAVDVGLFGAAL